MKPKSAEDRDPSGQALWWYREVALYVPRSGQKVAHQIARLCDDDSQVVGLSWRSLADAVGQRDRLCRGMAYAQRGVRALIEAGWLEVETIGRGRSAVTTWRLMVGPQVLTVTDLPTAA